jgi:hypothetical protein
LKSPWIKSLPSILWWMTESPELVTDVIRNIQIDVISLYLHTGSFLSVQSKTLAICQPSLELTSDFYMIPMSLNLSCRDQNFARNTPPHNNKHFFATLYWNLFMHVEVLHWASVLKWHLSVTYTFDLETWFMHETQLLMVVNICMKFH